MKLAHISRTWGALKKAHQFHKEQAHLFLDLFNQNKPLQWNLDAEAAPLLDFYQRTTEHHITQMTYINEMLSHYQHVVEDIIFDTDGSTGL